VLDAFPLLWRNPSRRKTGKRHVTEAVFLNYKKVYIFLEKQCSNVLKRKKKE